MLHQLERGPHANEATLKCVDARDIETPMIRFEMEKVPIITAKGKVVLCMVAFVTACPAFAFAQVTVDVSKITCKQFVLHEIARPRLVAIWLNGYYAGKRDIPTINIQALEKNTKEIERFCTKVDNLELPLMQAIEKVLGPGQ